MRATSTLMKQLAAKLAAQLLIGLALAASYVAPAAAQTPENTAAEEMTASKLIQIGLVSRNRR